MDDAFFMCCFECVRNLSGIVQRRFQWQRSFRTLALHQFHHEVIGTDVVQGADIRMIECGDCTNFTRETLSESLPRNLDGYVAPGPRILCTIDRSHTAGSDERRN